MNKPKAAINGLVQPVRHTRGSLLPNSRVSLISSRNTSEHTSLIPTRQALKDASTRSNIFGDTKESVINSSRITTQTISSKKEHIGDINDLKDCTDYETEIHSSLKKKELHSLPSASLFHHQTNIIPRMRSTVVDWLVDVHRKLSMNTDTLFYAINYMDRYLSVKDLDKSKYQLLGCTTILMAAKMEEISPPSVNDLVHYACDSFTNVALHRMETAVFAALDFVLNPVLPTQFLRRYLKALDSSIQETMMANFILETLLLDSDFIGFQPSLLASLTICLSTILIRGPGSWNKSYETIVERSLQEIEPILYKVFSSIVSSSASRFQAIRKKYAQSHMNSISLFEFPNELKIV